MSSQKITDNSIERDQREIDLIEVGKKIWRRKTTVLKVCGIGIIVGCILAISIPLEYTNRLKLAPEVSVKGTSGNMGALAAMAGINLSNNIGEDALSPELYPDIVTSTPFLLDLFQVYVTDLKGEIHTTLYEYMDDYQRKPWWDAIISLPKNMIGWGVSLFKDKNITREGGLDPFRLTPDEADVLDELGQRIGVSIDKKTGVTTISVTMQDPLVSAMVTDTVMDNLQEYITRYRTNKARHDLAFTEKLYEDAKKEYFRVQQQYARYTDGNQHVALKSYLIEQERLQNEMSLAYGIYNQVAQQLQVAKAKVQEITPVYTVVQPATVPLKPTKPGRMMILAGPVFLAALISLFWIGFVKS